MSWKYIILAISWSSIVSSERQNVSLVELSKCKQFQSFGYGYKSFFIVEDLHHLRNESDLLHTRLAILAGKDAHILLSETNNPTISDNVVEIVLGAGSNTYCEIRRRMGFASIKSRRVLDILSYVDPMAFVIRISKSGYIEVTYEGETEPLISGEYGNFSMSLHFIAFSCWGRSTCKFFFDCPNSLYDQLTETDVKLTPIVSLTNDIFTDLSVQVPPLGLNSVELGLDIFNVQFDQMRNILKTRAKIWYKWTDLKMVWDPENYDNIREYSTHYNELLVWNPIAKFPDGVGIRHVDSSGVPMRTTIYHNGTLRATSRHFTISTWCSVDDRSVKIWPHEHVKCNIHIFLANALDAGLARMDDHSPVVQQSENSQWSISLVDMTLKEGQITYTIVLKRNESFIDSLFGTPLNFALIMLICSIFMRQSIYRIFIVLLAALILFVTFLTLTKHVPPFYTPVIVQYYCGAFGLLLFALICQIVSHHFIKYPPEYEPPRWLVASFKNRFVNYLFCFMRDSMEYDTITKPADSWRVISTLMDGLLFLFVSVFLLIIHIQGF